MSAKNTFLTVLFLLLCLNCPIRAQSTLAFADSIRQHYQIPELCYAVVSSKEIIELEVTGVKKINTSRTAEKTDLFRIGSNTKAVTGMLAALLVKEKKIDWQTRFFDLFPELKTGSNKAYYKLTLLDLLSFRTRLFAYTYTHAEPTENSFTGDAGSQRYLFTQWFFGHEPVPAEGEIHFSNLGYVAAGLMLEKASGKSYQVMVEELGKTLDVHFGFGTPNNTDSLQTWGHNAQLVPEAPSANIKLEWLQAAGNIHMSLPDYAKFIQVQLKGLRGESILLSKKDFNFLHYGLERFSPGWFWEKDEQGRKFSYNIGNPGTFLTKVFVFEKNDRAFIVFSNAQSPAANEGLDVLVTELKRKYLN